MLSALATGVLIRQPKAGTAASGTRWANGIIRVPCGQSKEGDQESAFITVVCFGDHADKLSRLDKGDALSVQGQLKQTSYEKDGAERHGLEIVAQAVLSPYDMRKKRGADDAKQQPDKPHVNVTRASDAWRVYTERQQPQQDFDDALRF